MCFTALKAFSPVSVCAIINVKTTAQHTLNIFVACVVCACSSCWCLSGAAIPPRGGLVRQRRDSRRIHIGAKVRESHGLLAWNADSHGYGRNGVLMVLFDVFSIISVLFLVYLVVGFPRRFRCGVNLI